MTNHDYRFLAQEQMKEIGVSGEIVLEPERRDSAAAVAVACELAGARAFRRRRRRGFRRRPRRAQCRGFPHPVPQGGRAAAKGLYRHARHQADRPGDGLWLYPARRARRRRSRASPRSRPLSKNPISQTAERYIEQGYLWNSGNFFFRADVMRAELPAFAPEIAGGRRRAFAKAQTRSRLSGARQGSVRPRAKNLDRLCGDGADLARGGDSRPISAGPTSATGKRCGSFPTATRCGNSVRGHGLAGRRQCPCALDAWADGGGGRQRRHRRHHRRRRPGARRAVWRQGQATGR